MSYLIDTNIISEVERATGATHVLFDLVLFRSPTGICCLNRTLVLGEIRKEVEFARSRDPDKAVALERWQRQVEAAFDGRVVAIDNAVSDQWGRMCAIRPIPVIDGLLAATAATNGLTFVTRNDRDIAGLGAKVLNPFRIGEDHHRT